MSKSVKFSNPNADHYHENIMFASSLCLPQMEPGGYEGRTVVIAGSGPSLNDPAVLDEITRYIEEDNAILFACKAAVKVLTERGFKVDMTANIDPGQHIPQRIARVPGVVYYIASSSDPVLFKHLLDEPAMDVRIFHSACGLDIELNLYDELFNSNDVMMGGYNIVNRAFSIARHFGFEKFIFAGLDSGWREGQDFYCTKDLVIQKKVYLNDNGVTDGKVWHSTPDMLASAVALVKIAKTWDEKGKGDKIDFIGDVLPRVLRERTMEYLDTIAKMEKQPQL